LLLLAAMSGVLGHEVLLLPKPLAAIAAGWSYSGDDEAELLYGDEEELRLVKSGEAGTL
jgi:hypothetical protein